MAVTDQPAGRRLRLARDELLERPAQYLRARKGVRLAQGIRMAHAFLWEHICKRLALAQLLGRRGVLLTCASACAAPSAWTADSHRLCVYMRSSPTNMVST
jgi:hypothetical protein